MKWIQSVLLRVQSSHLMVLLVGGALLAYVALLMLQINMPPLERYPHWDSFLLDVWTIGHLSALRQALLSFELPAITPYVDFGWNALGDTSSVQHYLNPVHWLVLV